MLIFFFGACYRQSAQASAEHMQSYQRSGHPPNWVGDNTKDFINVENIALNVQVLASFIAGPSLAKARFMYSYIILT